MIGGLFFANGWWVVGGLVFTEWWMIGGVIFAEWLPIRKGKG